MGILGGNELHGLILCSAEIAFQYFYFLQWNFVLFFDCLVCWLLCFIVLFYGLFFEKGLMETVCSCVFSNSHTEAHGDCALLRFFFPDKQIQWDTFNYPSMQTYYKHLAHGIVDTGKSQICRADFSIWIQGPVEPGRLLWTSWRHGVSLMVNKQRGSIMCCSDLQLNEVHSYYGSQYSLLQPTDVNITLIQNHVYKSTQHTG